MSTDPGSAPRARRARPRRPRIRADGSPVKPRRGSKADGRPSRPTTS
jgi:hypothetical protein